MRENLYTKIWNTHRIHQGEDGVDLLYIDRQILHEVTSPQAFEGLRERDVPIWRAQSNLATIDHVIPTQKRHLGIHAFHDPVARIQAETLQKNCQNQRIALLDLADVRQGIVHVVGPEQGLTQPGMTIVCGDSHTSTHGAFATIAMGIGTSEVEHVLATQTIRQARMKTMGVEVQGNLLPFVSAKDLILAIIRKIGTAGGTGYAIEYRGAMIERLDMAGRMTICNMTIEAGARVGLIGCDDTTIEYLANRPLVPKGENWTRALQYWQTMRSDEDAFFDKEIHIAAHDLSPQVSWGTSPEMVVGIDEPIPDPERCADASKAKSYRRACEYMGVIPNTLLSEYPIDRVFIGSCTNSRIEDLRIAARIVKTIGKKVAANVVEAIVVPGSGLIKAKAEQEGLDKVFLEAGFQWRDPGCSMCLAMNPDKLLPKERCASTSNRNFEGRQGVGGRTHLASPCMATLAALYGRFIDPNTLDVLKGSI